MSTCISRAGEFGSHAHEEHRFICDRCAGLDEAAMLEEIDQLTRERDALPETLRENSPAGDALRERLGFESTTDQGVLAGHVLAHAAHIPSVPGTYHTLFGAVTADRVRRYRQWRFSTPWFEVET